MEKPFQAYAGDEPYVFVCYSHEDSELVYAELVWLREQGINIWYDEGISAGENWRAAIGDALLGASKFLFYLSARSLKSDHCNREINLALDEAKDVVPVYLEEVELTSDLMVGLNRVQALHRDQDESYQRHLLSALGHSTSTANTILDSAVVKPRRHWLKLATATSLLLVAALTLGYFYRDALTTLLVMRAPGLFFGIPTKQELGVATATDGTRIAYATSGDGPPIVYVLSWMTHLERGFNSPVYDNENLVTMTSHSHQFVRYDGRGFGLSDRDVVDLSLQARVSDLKAVVDKLGLERFGMLAVSSGGPTAIAFTAQYPERVSKLVLGSTFAFTPSAEEAEIEAYLRMLDLLEVAWQQPEVTEMFAAQALAPTGSDLDKQVYGELLRRCCDGDNVAAFFRTNLQIDVSEQAKQIRVPTLVIHARSDQAVPLEMGKQLTALIPDSKFEIVEGGHREGTASTTEVRRLALDFFSPEN
jgi:pimeloyl-ACP methyl ester carboxylesterase